MDETALKAQTAQYLAMLKADPGSRAFAPLADIYRKSGRREEALSLCRQGLARHPDYSGAQVLLAQILIDLKQFAAAEQELLKLLKRLPTHVLAHQLLLQLYSSFGTKRQQQARAIAARLIKLKPDDAAAQTALRAQTAAATSPAPPGPPPPTATMAKLYEEQGHLEKALEIYTLLAPRQPALKPEQARVSQLIANKKKVAILNDLLLKIRQQAGRP